MVEVDLNHIYKKYEGDNKYSANGFNLHTRDKELIVFVGPFGCGESATLRMVAGLEDISKGTLGIDHKVMNDAAPKDRNTAVVFQNHTLYPHMSIHGNMTSELKLRYYKKDEIDKRAKHTAGISGLSEYLDRKPSELPGGQRQRVALGRTIVRDVPTLLMDKPLLNLNAELRVTMRAEIARLHQNLGTTIIYVAHDQTETVILADRIVVMLAGRVWQIETPLKIYNEPVNTFVVGFIGPPQVNFFNVHFRDSRISNGKGLNVETPEDKVKMSKDKGYEDKNLVFSIRLEDIHLGGAFLETWPNQIIKSTAVVSELLGPTIQLYQKVDGTELVVIVNARDYHTLGDKVGMGFGVNKAHFFGKDIMNTIH